MKFVLYNPLSCNKEGEKFALEFEKTLLGEHDLYDMTSIASYSELFSKISSDDEIIICGGDGTLNRFINDIDGLDIPCDVYYNPMGTGNDFFADVKSEYDTPPILINEYINNLPTVTVNGKASKFLNGVGYGIDGYCCEIGDKLHEEGKPANYTAIAIKGLLFHYKPTAATVIVDGVEHKYKKVWIAPTMHGRRYGGGMIPTPAQRRGSNELSVMVFHDSGKLRTLMIFPSIFEGKHIEKDKYVTVFTGKQITVKFDAPRALQIDGETVLGVTEYTASV